jgi:hypothetical protein
MTIVITQGPPKTDSRNPQSLLILISGLQSLKPIRVGPHVRSTARRSGVKEQ